MDFDEGQEGVCIVVIEGGPGEREEGVKDNRGKVE
jgi:hypothetical protein